MGFYATLLIYCLAIMAASVVGGLAPLAVRFSHRRMQLATSVVAGFMLGVALVHLLPHALEAAPPRQVVRWLLAGLLSMFFLERFFSYHHHEAPAGDGGSPVTADAEPETDGCHEPGDLIDHHHGHGHGDSLTWSGAAVGLVLHSIIAGIGLAAAMLGESAAGVAWPGASVFLLIVLHKPFDSMTLLTLAIRGGMSRSIAHAVNALFALAVPLGAVGLFMGIGGGGTAEGPAVGCAIAFAAGAFLCVSLSDLLPELQFHRHDRIKLSAALMLGIALAWGIGRLESTLHEHGARPHDDHGQNDGRGSRDHDGHEDHGAI